MLDSLGTRERLIVGVATTIRPGDEPGTSAVGVLDAGGVVKDADPKREREAERRHTVHLVRLGRASTISLPQQAAQHRDHAEAKRDEGRDEQRSIDSVGTGFSSLVWHVTAPSNWKLSSQRFPVVSENHAFVSDAAEPQFCRMPPPWSVA
ncbi:hypothetical protein MKK69_18735 [Methylobacterium sp. J-026]|uniref:hypothetical protein n=1 Tax=Methylobacterium sp. J-026 TaxID=2836624 RepID=UPI001FB8F885|nr:hypothetical protein [Methylobacterium sp. J-026]MCJ2136060.1 hypothetical protein [Methylobacterium sp. J-026]